MYTLSQVGVPDTMLPGRNLDLPAYVFYSDSAYNKWSSTTTYQVSITQHKHTSINDNTKLLICTSHMYST